MLSLSFALIPGDARQLPQLSPVGWLRPSGVWPPLVPGGCLEMRWSFWEGGAGEDGLCASSADNGKDISLHPFLGIAFRLTRNRLSLPVQRTRRALRM